ncbi:MAG: nitrophenyl compound nitroreductase subunit ArsF family protein [bacterium]
MKAKTVVTSVLLAFVAISIVFLVVKETRSPRAPAVVAEPAGGSGSTATKIPDSKLIVYYFHGTKRCNTCRTIEAYTEEAVRSGFPTQLETGRIVWRPVNVDEPENEHFVEDYGLTTRTVVLVDVEQGHEEKWTKLDRVWDLVGDKDAFIDYITKNTGEYLAGRDG